jgi:hypothetical protein
MTTLTDGEWKSAQEALDYLGLGSPTALTLSALTHSPDWFRQRHAGSLFMAFPTMMTLRFPVSSGRGATKRSGTIGGQATSRQRLMTVISKHLVSNSVVRTSSD